jgi:hypothetical protein
VQNRGAKNGGERSKVQGANARLSRRDAAASNRSFENRVDER